MEFPYIQGNIAVVGGAQTMLLDIPFGIALSIKAFGQKAVPVNNLALDRHLEAKSAKLDPTGYEGKVLKVLGKVQCLIQPVAVLQLQNSLPFIHPVRLTLALFCPYMSKVNGMAHKFTG